MTFRVLNSTFNLPTYLPCDSSHSSDSCDSCDSCDSSDSSDSTDSSDSSESEIFLVKFFNEIF